MEDRQIEMLLEQAEVQRRLGNHRGATDLLQRALTIDGAKRHVVMTVPRDGDFFVLDATKGTLISVKALDGRLPQQAGSGPERPKSGHNWWPMSYNPITKLVYVPGHKGILLNERADELAREAVVTRSSRAVRL